MIEYVQDTLIEVALPLLALLLAINAAIFIYRIWPDLPSNRHKTEDGFPLPAQSKRGKPKRYTDYVYDEDGPENYED